MNEEQNDPEKTGMSLMMDAELCESDRSFLRSLDEFIQEQKKYLQCPDEGADELRYIIYRSAFNKLIGRATAYRRLLLAIKSGYDDIIRETKRREEEAAAGAATRLEALLRRAAVLTDRISALQNQTAELQEEVRRQRSTAQSRLVPGLTVAQSEDPEALQAHLEHLQTQREVLLAQRSRCVPVEVQTRMTIELQGAEQHRDRLRDQNHQLATQFRRLKLVSERLENWEGSGRMVPLEDLLSSTVQNMEAIRTGPLQEEENDEDSSRIHPEMLEEELDDHLGRFLDLFGSGRYRAAALLAARPPGVLRSADTMQMFSGVSAPPGSAPPALLFFQALLVTVAAGSRLPGRLSLQGVGCALRHGDLQLVVHAVTQNKLTFSEELGDALTEHAQRKPGVADLCLALASTVYQACGKQQKAALSMLRRGLVHGAAEVMKQQRLTAEEILWVLSCSPSLSLLQLLTDSQAAILSVGGACASMLADPRQRQVALELLDGLLGRGRDVLRDAILEDSGSSVDVWDQVAFLCSQLQRDDLSRAVRSVLLDQDGTGLRSPDLEGGRLMEHVFL